MYSLINNLVAFIPLSKYIAPIMASKVFPKTLFGITFKLDNIFSAGMIFSPTKFKCLRPTIIDLF